MLFRKKLMFALCGSGLALGLALLPAEAVGTTLPPGDPDRAVEAEYAVLSARGTRAALELFIARHPDHPLAERARRALRDLPR